MKKLLLALLFALNLAPALAQAPPPVPALPDAERRTSYSISATTCACSVGFQLYGDSTDVDAWLAVWINGVKYLSTDPTHGWAITSATGPLATIPRPITNAVLTFNSAQTGTVQIVGSRRPRRAAQFSENRGVAARDLNQVLTDNIATERERWDTVQQRIIQSPPGETLSVLPPVATRKGSLLGFDVNGNPQLFPPANVTGAGGGNMVGPVVATPGNLPLYGSSPNILTDSGTSLSSVQSSITSNTASILAVKSRIQLNDGVNIRDFGAVGDGVTDDTVAIQAAIDCSYGTGTNPATSVSCSGNSQGRTFCPDGRYITTLPIFVDPPGNLRGSATAWSSGTTYAINNVVRFNGVPFISLQNSNTNHSPSADLTNFGIPVWWKPTTAAPSSFSQASIFYGAPQLSNNGSAGCQILPAFNSAMAMTLSTGQGNYALNFTVQAHGFFSGYGCTLYADSLGLGIPGGGGGASFTKVENVQVANFFTGIRTGYNQDSLADSNTFVKIRVEQTCRGVWLSQTQNFINSFYDSNVCGTIGLTAVVNNSVNVYGGNWSPCDESSPRAVFTIGSTSAVTATGGGSPYNQVDYTFTTTVTSPDALLVFCATNPVAQCAYNAFTIVTSNMGVIPITLTAFNSSTNVASFKVSPLWSAFNYWTTNAVADADLQAEIQGPTKLYASQQVTIWNGCDIHVYGSFLETNSAPLRVVDNGCGFGSSFKSYVNGVQFNGDATINQQNPFDGTTGFELAPYYAGMSYPTVNVANDLTIEAWNFAARNWIFDFSTGNSYFVARNSALENPNLRAAQGGANTTSSCQFVYRCGSWLPNPFNNFNATNGSYTTTAALASPTSTRGFYPTPDSMPRLSTAFLTTLMGALPALTSPTNVGYPLVNGTSIYQVLDDNGAISGTSLFAKSAHYGWSYGQDLTLANTASSAWSYKGQTNQVYMSTNLIGMMFPGLVIGLDNGGGNAYYTVTGVYPKACKGTSCATYQGYVTTSSAPGSPGLLAGTKTTVYTGTTVAQQPYAFTQYP